MLRCTWVDHCLDYYRKNILTDEYDSHEKIVIIQASDLEKEKQFEINYLNYLYKIYFVNSLSMSAGDTSVEKIDCRQQTRVPRIGPVSSM